jgi:hypothetical protein
MRQVKTRWIRTPKRRGCPCASLGGPMSERIRNITRLLGVYRAYLSLFPQAKLIDIVHHRYSATSPDDMSVEQIAELVSYFESVVGAS